MSIKKRKILVGAISAVTDWLGGEKPDFISDCTCGKGGRCITNNYDIVGDGVLRAKREELLDCPRFKASVKELIDAELTRKAS